MRTVEQLARETYDRCGMDVAWDDCDDEARAPFMHCAGLIRTVSQGVVATMEAEPLSESTVLIVRDALTYPGKRSRS